MFQRKVKMKNFKEKMRKKDRFCAHQIFLRVNKIKQHSENQRILYQKNKWNKWILSELYTIDIRTLKMLLSTLLHT